MTEKKAEETKAGEDPKKTQEPAEAEGADDKDKIDPTEAKARERGWKPESEFGKEGEKPKDFLTPKEFIFKGKFVDRLSKQNKEHTKEMDSLKAKLKENSDLTTQILEDSATIKAQATKDAIVQLRKESREAVEDGDGPKADKLDKKIDDLHEKQLGEKETKQEKTDHKAAEADRVKAIQEYGEKNEWFRNDKELNTIFSAIAKEIYDKDQTLSIRELIDKADREFKEKYKRLFENPRRDDGEAVGSGRARKKETGGGWDSVPQNQREAFELYVKGHPGDEAYAKRLKQKYLDMNEE